MNKKYFIIIFLIFCYSAKANNKIPIVSKVDGYYYWQSKNHNEYSTGIYCEQGVYIKRNKKFCKTNRKSEKGEIVCKIEEGKEADKIMFCARGTWAEIYKRNDDGTCITYIYDNLLDIRPRKTSSNINKGDIIGWVDNKERTKPVIIFNGCYK